MKLTAILLPLSALAYVLFALVRVARLIRIAAALTADARSFTNTNGALSVLVLGDSTAVGVGTKQPEKSVAGRLSGLLNARIENCARSGAVVSDLLQQLNHAQHGHYDLVLIQAGGNDIIRFRPLLESNAHMDRTLTALADTSDRIILLTAGRIGLAPFFPKLVAPLFTRRSLTLRSLFTETARKHNTLYIDLFGTSNTFNADPDRFYAADMLHLSGDGYGVWFEKLEEALRARWPELFTATPLR